MTDGTDRVQALRPRPTRPIQVDAVLFDLDGVVTRTAQVHAAAWKRAFDEWFDLRARADGVERQRFDQDRDYRLFVDGRPRHDGVRGFLRSRGIDLPHGTEADDADQDTVCGIAARKNRYFRDWLAHHRVESLPGTLALLGELRQAGVKAGVFSASRNARAVLASAGVTERFDVVVDGHDAVDRGLAGKPDPAVLLEAAARLGVSPDRTAVVEDAVAGIVAGVRGGFGLVIGVDRSGGNGGLREAGADIVVADSSEVTLMPNEGLAVKTLDALPLVWSRQDEIRQRLSARSVALFVDYDGTLTPIVEDFTKAFLATDMRAALEEASRRCTVAVVSGRDIHLLRSLVRLESVYYAGSHGFEIAGPAGWTGRVEKGVECLPALDRAERALAGRLTDIPGHAVERKRFSIAVHYRRVPDDAVPRVEAAVDAVVAEFTELRKGRGKKVFEIQPDIEWDKGQAVLWLLDRLGLDRPDVVPVYIGDDVTDEDAFRVIVGRGVAVGVRDGQTRQTSAAYAVANTEDVRAFLAWLATIAGGLA